MMKVICIDDRKCKLLKLNTIYEAQEFKDKPCCYAVDIQPSDLKRPTRTKLKSRFINKKYFVKLS